VSQTFPRAGRLTQGYDVRQVDAFFARARRAYAALAPGAGPGGPPGPDALRSADVRTAAFDLVRGGYEVGPVDAALDRLEDALADRERAERRRVLGGQGALDEVGRAAGTLDGRLRRPDGQRFVRGEGWQRTYDVSDVDELCQRLVAYLHAGEAMSADEVRRAVFRPRRGRRGYAEPVVDAFLDRAVEVMVAAE
jgi:DivIVA domain-containing protein